MSNRLPHNPSAEQMLAQLSAIKKIQRAEGPVSAATRQDRLQRAMNLFINHVDEFTEASSKDFGGRPPVIGLQLDGHGSVAALKYNKKNLAKWMKPSKRATALPFNLFGGSTEVRYQPKGVIGIAGTWNASLFTVFAPLAGVLAAGNRAMIKPSDLSPHMGEWLQKRLPEYFDPMEVSLVTGDMDVSQQFTALPFDHLVYTGGGSIAKHIMRAAAENLVPLTLELGGKSPAIVSADVPLKDAAERIAFGKTFNAGQTCVAPDYVLVPEDRVEGFVEAYSKAVRGFYPTLVDNPDYTAIINERQLARLNAYAKDATDKGATLIPLYEQGQARRMAHSLLLNVSDDMTVMQDEIFGPLLPIVPYRGLDQAFAYINQRPRPLALYYFGYNKGEQARVLHETHSGGVCLNDTLLHVAQDDMPFGGIGPSGMGHYHGHEGFLTFSKAKGVLVKQRLNAAKLIYPPYGKSIQKLIQKLFIR